MASHLWYIEKTKKLEKQIEKLPISVQALVYALFVDLEIDGPRQPGWPNYSSLGKRKKNIPNKAHHCHLKQGRPTYVACWYVVNEKEKIIEVFYVGTHEKAPY